MTLDELFDSTFAGSSKPLAVLSISSGPQQGVYRMQLEIVPQSAPPKVGPAQPRPAQELQGVVGLQLIEFNNTSLILTITRDLGHVVLGPPKGAFHVSVDVSRIILGHPRRTTNIAFFATPADGPAVRPCQTSEAYFQSLEPTEQLVRCCIFHQG
jgi:hypothetical protein